MMNTALENTLKAIAFVSAAIQCLESNKESTPDYKKRIESLTNALNSLEAQKNGIEEKENNTFYTTQDMLEMIEKFSKDIESSLYQLFSIINIYKPEKPMLDQILELIEQSSCHEENTFEADMCLENDDDDYDYDYYTSDNEEQKIKVTKHKPK